MSGQLQRGVTTYASPLPIQPNGKLLNQNPFSLEDKKCRNSYTVGVAVSAFTKGVGVTLPGHSMATPPVSQTPKVIWRSQTLGE